MSVAPPVEATEVEEQIWFDELRAVREEKRERNALAYQSGANPKVRAAIKRAVGDSETLGPPDVPVAFLRVDAVGEDEPIYIGEHGLHGNDSDILVVNWKSGLAMRLRGATHSDHRGVARRRTFQTKSPNQIVSIDDVIFADLARKVLDLERGEADLAQSDEFLQSVLGRERSPEMDDIVRTIQAAQADIIAAPANQLMVVQGGPGTGKTAVALHRAATLLFNDLRGVDERILIVGPSDTFLQYISRVSRELGGPQVVSQSLDKAASADVTFSVVEEPDASRLKGLGVMKDVLEKALRDRIRVPEGGARIGLTDLSFDVPVDGREVERILSEIEPIPYVNGRALFRSHLDRYVVNAAREAGRQIPRNWTASADQSTLEAYVERVWPQLSAPAALRDLLGSAERLLSAAGPHLTAEEVLLLRRQAATRLSDQLWSKEDAPLIDYIARLLRGTATADQYEHVVVDEAQDLSPMQISVLRAKSINGAMTVVGDIAQSTGPWARDSWDDLIDELSSELPSVVQTLRFGYRVPAEVMAVAGKLLPEAAPGLGSPEVVTRAGRPPNFTEVAEPGAITAVAVERIALHSSKGRFVGVICPREHQEALQSALDGQDIKWSDANKGGLSNAINLVSPETSKGLEFDAVVVLDPQSIVESNERGLRLLYVALTRTTGDLDVIYPSGTLPTQLAIESGPVSQSERTDAASTEERGAKRDRPDQVELSQPMETSSTASARATSPSKLARARTVEFGAESVLDMLVEIAPEQLWAEIIGRINDLLADRPGKPDDLG